MTDILTDLLRAAEGATEHKPTTRPEFRVVVHDLIAQGWHVEDVAAALSLTRTQVLELLSEGLPLEPRPVRRRRQTW